MKRVSRILLVCCIASIGYVTCQYDPTARCEPYAGFPSCKDRLKNPSSIFVTETLTQDLFNQNVTALFNSLQFMPTVCTNEHTFKLVCNNYFQECINVTISSSVSVAIFNRQCRPDCQRGLDECPIDHPCNLTIPYYNVYEFPIGNNSFNMSFYGGSSNYTVACFATDSIVTNGQDIPCPAPFYTRNSTNRQQDIDDGYNFVADSKCVYPCPSPFFSREQWDMLSNMAYGLGTISFITTLFNIFTYAVLNRKYDRHAICIIFMSFSFWLVMLTDVVFLGVGWKLNCPSPDRFARQQDKGCLATGIIFQFGVTSAIMWWSTMSLDLYLVLKKVKNTSRSYEKIYIGVINLIALILTLTPLSQNQYGYSISGLGCWIMDDNWLNGNFWGPLSVCLFVGISFIVLILYEVLKIVNRVDTGKKKSMRILKYNLKPFVIIMFLFIEFVYMFAYHFYTQEQTPVYQKGMEDFIRCVATGGGVNCKAVTIPFGAHFIYLFFIRLIGIEVMVFYGLNRRAKKIWQSSFVFNNKFFKFKFASTTKSNSSNSKQDIELKKSDHNQLQQDSTVIVSNNNK